MFRKLRIRLTLINLALTTVILIIVFAGMYIFMQADTAQRSEEIMQFVAKTERTTSAFDSEETQRMLSNCFFIKIDASASGFTGEISSSDISSNMLMTLEDATNLVNRAIRKNKDTGKATGDFRYKGIDLRFLIAEKPYGFIFVFLPKDTESNVMESLFISTVKIGIVGLILIFFVSLYLSKKSLVPVKKAWEKEKSFVADASHELRTPLAVINTNLELVMGNPEETVESQYKWLANIHSEIKRMSNLVKDLLFLARADSNENKVNKSWFNLSKSLVESKDLFEPLAADNGIKLLSDIQPDVNFYGNEGQIKQLVAIFIDNAIKHTPAEGYIQLKMKATDSNIELQIEDTGEGIPKEHLSRIFERFYRVDKARSRSSGGSGLGLSIADTIVKDHKGYINVTSAVGEGTTFKIIFPRKGQLAVANK